MFVPWILMHKHNQHQFSTHGFNVRDFLLGQISWLPFRLYVCGVWIERYSLNAGNPLTHTKCFCVFASISLGARGINLLWALVPSLLQMMNNAKCEEEHMQFIHFYSNKMVFNFDVAYCGWYVHFAKVKFLSLFKKIHTKKINYDE